MNPYQSIWQYLRDVAIGFFLIIGGFILAAHIAQRFPQIPIAYPLGLCIGILPFWHFTRWCQIHDFDWIDYLAFSATYLTVQLVIDDPQLIQIKIVIMLAIMWCFRRLRAYVRDQLRNDCGH